MILYLAQKFNEFLSIECNIICVCTLTLTTVILYHYYAQLSCITLLHLPIFIK